MRVTIFNRRLLATFMLGFSSGLPIGLVGSTLQAWYTVSGASLMVLGWLTLIGQPYAYKFLWAPLLDRFSLFSLGRRRSWIVVTQGLLILGLVCMAFLNPVKQPFLLAVVALAAAFFSATQDTAIDAYRTELLLPEERGIGVSLNSIAYRLALMVAGALALILAEYLSFSIVYLLMAGCFAVLMGLTFFAPNPPIAVHQPQSFREMMWEPLRNFFSRQHALIILLFIVLYKLCDAMALSLNTAFLIRGVGFSLVEIGAMSKTVGLAAGLIGSFLGGVLLTRISLFRGLFWFGLLQALANLLYAWLYIVGKNVWIMSIAIFGENFFSGLGSVAFVVFLMTLCDKRYTATQYALFSAVAALGRIFIGPVSAVLVAHMGWVGFYVLSTIIGFPALFLLKSMSVASENKKHERSE